MHDKHGKRHAKPVRAQVKEMDRETPSQSGPFIAQRYKCRRDSGVHDCKGGTGWAHFFDSSQDFRRYFAIEQVFRPAQGVVERPPKIERLGPLRQVRPEIGILPEAAEQITDIETKTSLSSADQERLAQLQKHVSQLIQQLHAL